LSSYTPNFSFEPISPLENAKIIHLLDHRRKKKKEMHMGIKAHIPKSLGHKVHLV